MCTPGLQFGSRFVVPPMQGLIYDYLPEHLLDRVRNLGEFAGMLALDKWTCNANGRQAAFWKKRRERKFTVSSSTRDIASMRESGRFRIRRCGECLRQNDVYAR